MIHIPSDSIFSDSVDFTVVSSRTYDPSSSLASAHLVMDNDSLFEPRPRKKQSTLLEEVASDHGPTSATMAAPSYPQTQAVESQFSTTDNGDTSAFAFPSFCLRA